MSEEKRIEAGSQMNEQEKNQITLEFAKLNTSVNESMSQTNQSLSQQQTSQIGNETSDLLLTGSFIGVGDGIHDAQGIAKVIPIEGGGDILRLEDLVVTNGLLLQILSKFISNWKHGLLIKGIVSDLDIPS
jgi:hypothetical protein